MNESKEKYQKIVNELIKKSFHELKGRRIKVVEFPNIFPWAESFATNGFKYHYIFINKTCRSRDKKELAGQLAHELCHLILDYLDKGFIFSLWHFNKKNLSFAFNTKFSRKIEKRVDSEVIRRGYAKELLALQQRQIKDYGKENSEKSTYPRGYLSPEQIKYYAKKIKKWQ